MLEATTDLADWTGAAKVVPVVHDIIRDEHGVDDIRRHVARFVKFILLACEGEIAESRSSFAHLGLRAFPICGKALNLIMV